MRATSYAIGLDLGQSQDYSALAVLQHVAVLPSDWTLHNYHRRLQEFYNGERYPQELPPLRAELRVVHLQRWELGTPYTDVVNDAAALARTWQLSGSRFLFDRSGVGRPVGDLFWKAYEQGRMGETLPEGRTITGAERSGRGTTAKRDLIAALEIPIQQGRFKIPAGLPLADVLERELTSFQMKITAKQGRESYDIERRAGEGHGDLVIAVALAAVQPEYAIEPELVAADPSGNEGAQSA